MKASNITRNRLLGDSIVEATTFLARMKGLLGTRGLGKGEGLWIFPCGCIHSFGMRYEFDVIFLDAQGRVVALYDQFARNRTSRVHWDAKGVLELPPGTVAKTGTCLRDVVSISPVPGVDR